MNLVSLAMNFLTPAIVSKIGNALGIQSSFAQKAIAAALPTILGSVIGKSSSPGGLDMLMKILGKQDTSILGNLGSLIGGGGQAAMVNQGTDALGSLLGNSSLGALAGAVSKFSGAGQDASKSLLGMLAPVALGTIAQQQNASNLDAGGLARMLAGQKDNIAAAMPAGFGDLLKGTGLLDGVLPAAVAAPAAKPASHTPPAPAKSGGIGKLLPWAALVALLLLGYNYLSGSRTPATPPVPSITFQGVDVGKDTAALVDTLKGALGNVKDAASAQAQLPKLQEASTKLAQLEALQKQMQPPQKSALASLIGGYLPAIQGLVKTAMNAAGVPAILQPVLEGIVNRMIGMSKA